MKVIEGIEKRIKENYISTTLVTLNMTCMYGWIYIEEKIKRFLTNCVIV